MNKNLTRSLAEKKDLILAHEEQFAFALAREMVEGPKLSIWMVLIPIIFLHYFHRYRKAKEGRTDFARNYLITRKRALEESIVLVEAGKRPKVDEILRDSSLPKEAGAPFKTLFSLLLEHYADLLRSDGSDMTSLIRSAYRRRANYLLFLNRLNQAEKDLHAMLRPHLGASMGDVGDVIKRMERISERLRRESAEHIFISG